MTTDTKILTGRHIFRDAGMTDTGATFDVETSRSGIVSVVFHSRGTTAGSRAYRTGLALVLDRLAAYALPVSEVCVETKTTKDLTRAARRVYKGTPTRPNLNSQTNLYGGDKVRAMLGSAAAKVGRPPGAKGGGNGTKRLRLYLDTIETSERVADQLAYG